MPAYHVEWHMRQALKPILFDEHDEPDVDVARGSVVAAALAPKLLSATRPPSAPTRMGRSKANMTVRG